MKLSALKRPGMGLSNSDSLQDLKSLQGLASEKAEMLDDRIVRSNSENAHSNYRKMISRGALWQRHAKELAYDEHRPVAELSERNLTVLKQKVGELNKNEAVFYNNVMAQPWFLTHFARTDTFFLSLIKRAHVHLKSYDTRAQEAQGKDVFTNAAASDIEELGATNFVYFCLEIGKSLKKKSTRSYSGGTTILRTKLDQPVMQHSASYHGDIFDGLRVSDRLGLPVEERRELNRHLARFESDVMNADNGFTRTIFYGPQAIKEGTVLQVILDARHIDEPRRNRLLTRRNSVELNKLVSSLSRTQVLVPEECVLDDFEAYHSSAQ